MQEAAFDTRMPLNINDTDLTAEMTQPPVEREGVTEMTFCLMRCHAMRVVWKLGYMAPRKKFGSAAADTHLDSANQNSLVNDLENLLQDRYLKHCDTRIPFPRLTVSVARIITLRLWMTILSPRGHTDKTIRERLFNITVQILQLSNDMLTSEDMRQWAWHSKTHLQCYSIAFLLAELCRRPPSPECDHAWECVTAVYERWNGMETEKRGPLWRSIQRLMARARYVREVQTSSIDGTGMGHPWKVAGEAMMANKDNIGPTVTATALGPQDRFCGVNAARDPSMDMLNSFFPNLFNVSAMDISGLVSESDWFPITSGGSPDIDIVPSPGQRYG